MRQLALAWVVSAVFCTACGSTAPSVTDEALVIPEPNVAIEAAALGAGDVIDVRVYMEDALSGLYRVSSDGTFNFPLVGEVHAEGLTSGQLANELATRLRDGYIRNPQVSVFIKEFQSKKIVVLGAVQKPGAFTYEDQMTAVQALSLAGGLKPVAAKNSAVLTRRVDGEEKRFTLRLEDIGLGRAQNPKLQPGDILFVPESWL